MYLVNWHRNVGKMDKEHCAPETPARRASVHRHHLGAAISWTVPTVSLNYDVQTTGYHEEGASPFILPSLSLLPLSS